MVHSGRLKQQSKTNGSAQEHVKKSDKYERRWGEQEDELETDSNEYPNVSRSSKNDYKVRSPT